MTGELELEGFDLLANSIAAQVVALPPGDG
jgi:hypothetical protein